MAVEEGWSFTLPERPESACYSPSTNSLVVCGKEGKISCYDLISGQQLCEAESPTAKAICTFNVATGKLVMVNNKCIGARKDFNGIYLLDSILQPPQEDPNAAVILELPLNQVPDLYNELQTMKGKKNISVTIKENKASDAKREKWATCCIRGSHKSLLKDFVQPHYDYRTGSVAAMKPIMCQLRLRLMLLGQQPNAFSKYECGGDTTGSFNKQSGHMYCEAVRRYSFKSWPHKNYTWAVPDSMAAAGFFLAGSEHHYGSYSMADRTLCFCCNVSLHRWEPTDEPWSEHERHSSKCPFIRGEYTENVSITCTEATHPAQCYCPNDVNTEVSCVSATANGVGLVAVGNSAGSIFVYDLTKHLMLWETWSFRVDEDRIGCGLNLLCQQIKADEQQEKLRQKNNLKKLPGPLPAQVANQMKREEKQEEKDEKVNAEEKVEKQVIKQEGKDETDNIKEKKEVDKQTEKHEGETDTDNKEQGKEIEKENVVGTEPLHQQEGKTSKTHEQKQEGDQENKTVKEGEHPTSQHDHPVSSCKLHSLGIVQLMKESDTRNTSASPKSSNKGDESSNVDPSLLIGVSYCRSSGAQEAAIIVCDIHTYKSVATSIKKNKAKSTALSSAGIGIEPMSDPLMDIDDVMPSALPITVDIDTPSWELVPPLPPEPPLVSSVIPPPPPLPPLKNGNASKTEKGSQLQIFVVSEYIDDLPVDAHPVVSVIQPCGYSRVAVALEYGSSYGGCIILFNLEQCTGKTILGKSIIYEFVESNQQVLDMCVMENLETRRNGDSHFLAAVTRSGSFVVFSIEMNVVVSMSVNSDPFVSCFPCVNVGLFGLVTRSGVVKTVKVVSGKPVPEVSVLAADVANSDTAGDSTISTSQHKDAFSEVLSMEYLQSCYEAVQFATNWMGYIAHAPPGWESISMEQLHKRSPQHVCHKGQTRGGGDVPPLTWQYNLPAGEINSHTDDTHHFDLCFAQKNQLGHLDVTFILYHPDAVNQDTLVSLVLHRLKGATDKSTQYGEVICGPVRLQNFIDVVGNTACIKFTHPDLMNLQNCICSLVIENISCNITEPSKKATTVDSDVALHYAFSRNVGRSKAFRRSLIRKGRAPYHVQSEKPKATEEKKLAVMVKAYPFAKMLTESDLELHQLLINDIVCHENLVLVVTRYQVAKSELENLSPCLREVIEKLEQSKDTPRISQKMCYQAFDMLCWIAGVLLYDKTRFRVFLKSVGGLLSSLLYSCFLDDMTPLSLPLKFLRFLHLCGRSEMIDPDAHGLFMDQLLKAILAVLPLVFTMSYKGNLQLFFHIMSSHVGPHRQLEILTACRENLASLTLQLQPGAELITQLLRAEFDLPVIRRRSLLAHPPPVSLPLGLDTMTAESRYYTNERHSDDTELQLLINSSDSVLVKHTSEAPMNNSNANVWPFPSKSMHYPDTHTSYGRDVSKSEKGLRNPFFARRFSTTLLETLTLSFSFKSFSHSSMSVVDKSLPSKKESLDLESLLVNHESGVTVGYNVLPPDTSKDSDYVPKSVEDVGYFEEVAVAQTLFALFDLPCLMRSKQILIENIESGVGYSVVLDLERTTELTNVCLNTSHHRIGSVIVDVWGEDETEDSAVRLVQTTDVKSKSITVGSLLPSPVCRYIKITFVVALGANRESIQFPIGLLFGRPLCAIEHPLPCHLIQEIQHRLKCKCYTVQSSLAPMVALYLDLYHTKSSQQQVLKGLGLSIRELYEACRNAEIQLDRFKRVVIERQDRDDKIPQPCVVDLKEKATSMEDIETNRFEIIAQYLVSVSIIILGQKSMLSLMDTTDDETSLTDNIPLILDPRLPKWCLRFTREECRTLFYSLCVHGVAEEQVRVCVFLVQACGAEEWWSSFITDAFLDLFCSNPGQVFSKEKVFLIISTMIQKTLSPEMLSCLMQAAGRLLNPLESSDSDKGSLDMEQIEWLLFLFSHMLSSVGATGITQNGIILPGASTSQVSNTSYAHKLNEIENQIKEKQNRIDQLGSKAFTQSGNGDKTFLLKKVQEIKEQTERERAALSEDASKIRKHLDERSKQDSDDRTVVSLTMLSAVTDDVKQQLARGIMSLIVSYINGSVSIDAVLGACSTLSLLVDSCSTSLQLSCLITSDQFCQLLSFCISWQLARAGNSDPQQGKLQWMCRSVVSLISQIVRNEYKSYLEHTTVTAGLGGTVDTKDYVVKHKISEIKDKVAADNEDETDSSKVAGSAIPVVGGGSTKNTSDTSETPPQKLSTRLATTSVYSSAVDYRLMNSFNLLAEKDYQRITNAEFEHVITAIRHSGSPQHQKFHCESKSVNLTDSPPDQFNIDASRQTAGMLTNALNDLLTQAHDPLNTITLVDVLEFWNSLIIVDPSKLLRSNIVKGGSVDSSDATVLFFSLELVDLLLKYIVDATIPILLQTWQLVFSFLSNMLTVNKCDTTGIDNLLNSALLSKALVKFFAQKWSTSPLVEAREESGCLLEDSFSSFFTEVVDIICVNQDVSVACGLQLLMDVLSESLNVLFQSGGSTYTVMLFAERFSSEVSLTKSLSLLDEKPAQKLLQSFSNLFLCGVKFVKSYLNFSQRDQFELRGTESRVQRHHYVREETTTWIKCQSDGHLAGKLCSYLLQSLRQLSSETNISEKALNALLIFTGQQTELSSTEENHKVTLSYTVSEHPFLEILFSNEELLYNVLTTLNSNISSHHALLSKPKTTRTLPNTSSSSSDGFVLHIFQNFVQSIVNNCTNMACFLKPSLRCLKDSLSSHSHGYGLSTLIASILAKIFDVPSSSGNKQLVQFLKLGGADLVFQGLIRSCQFNRKVGKSIFSSTMAQVTKSDPLQPTSKDGNLVNYASLAAVKLLSNSATQSMNTRLQGLVGVSQTYSTSRSAVLVTTDSMFVNGWLNIVLKLPYPILLHAVQVYHPTSSSYSNSSPSMMALGILHQSNNNPPLPVVSPIITGGIHCQELKLSQPKPAQEIVIYLRRPTNDGQLSLSQISVLGTDLLSDSLPEDNKTAEEHPSTGWLNLLCDWMLSSCGEEIITLLLAQAESQSTALVNAGLKFLHESTISDKMENFLLFLSGKLEEFRTALLKKLMGISSGKLPMAPLFSNATIQLLYKLCVSSSNNMLFSAIGWMSQPSVVSKLPATYIRAIASAVWLRKGQENLELLLSQDTFSALLEYAISLEVTSSSKSAMCSLLCAVCATIPSYFATFITSTRQLYDTPNDLDAKLLYCTAMLCTNNGCLATLWDSGAVVAICERLNEIFVKLNNIHTETTSTAEEATVVNSSLVVACRLLAFLTQLVSNHLEAKNLLLETGKACDFWKPMMEYLVYHHKAYSQAKNVFFLQVVIKFFRECMCIHAASKIAFVKIIINLMLHDGTGEPAITPLLYNLIITFIFNMDYIPVVVNMKKIPPDLALPSHLVRTYESQQFHPSYDVSITSFIVHFPLSSTLHQIQDYCLYNAAYSGSAAPPSKQESHLDKKSPPDYTMPDDMYYWYNENEEFYAGPGSYVPPKHKLRSKITADKPDKTASSLPEHKMLFGDDFETFQGNVKLLTVLHHRQPSGRLPCILNCSVVETKSVTGDTGLVDSDLKKTEVADMIDALSIFIAEGGLQIVSRCLPCLYKHFWPKEEIYQYHEKAVLVTYDKVERPILRSHVLSSLPSCIPFHSLFMLGLCLRIKNFSLALSGQTITFMMLRALLGIESGVNQDLTFEPYNQFQRILAGNPVGTNVGDSLRMEAFTIGVIHHLLQCLSIAGHHPSRCREKDSTISSSSAFKINNMGGDSAQPSSVAVEGKQYWAKGTGFGTGSFNSKWNMKETVTKQQQEEALVTILFEVLGKYFKMLGGITNVECFSSELLNVCANSCLLPALASYLHNDSVLDMSKHIMLYVSVMHLLQGISSNLVLRPLLLINYTAPEVNSSSQTVAKLLAQLKETVTKYCKTVRIGDKSKTKSSSDTELGSENQTGPPLPPRDNLRVKEKGSLNELIASIKVTCELVAHMAQELKHQESEEGKDNEAMTQPTQTLDELYMETMKPLQFDTHSIVTEDENGQNVLHVPYHYGDRLITSSSAQMSAAKARRLAQEIATLSTSLPLSPSSSVFVRCDEEQLDVMKVLITGPADTPYANGCFLCDVFFPVEYPNKPMLVNLATTGNSTVRFNPNLYADGKVCLSILNTWQGRPEEKWNAQTSSFLQVLVSIQSLILVPEPYFNEPGYEQYRGSSYGNKRCLVYNGELYCNTMKWAIIEQIRNPDPCFKEVIYRHYHIRRDEVLHQCRKWQKELESAVDKYHDDSSILKQIKTQLNKISQLLPTLQHVLYNSIDLSEFEKKEDQKNEETNTEENA